MHNLAELAGPDQSKYRTLFLKYSNTGFKIRFYTRYKYCFHYQKQNVSIFIKEIVNIYSLKTLLLLILFNDLSIEAYKQKKSFTRI